MEADIDALVASLAAVGKGEVVERVRGARAGRAGRCIFLQTGARMRSPPPPSLSLPSPTAPPTTRPAIHLDAHATARHLVAAHQRGGGGRGVEEAGAARPAWHAGGGGILDAGYDPGGGDFSDGLDSGDLGGGDLTDV